MGTLTLEARLRSRLLLLVVPALVLVASVAVGATSYLLRAADSRTALAYATELRELFRSEVAENDPPSTALAELRSGLEPTGVRVSVREHAKLLEASGAAVPTPELLQLTGGACATARDAQAHLWRGCSVGDLDEAVIVAIPVDIHHNAVLLLAEVLGGVVIATLIGFVLSLRGALRAPVAELDSLVRWATRPLEKEHVAPAPAQTREIHALRVAFEEMVKRLHDALVREHSSSAHIAHELRTPLTSILGELDAIEPHDESERGSIDRIRRDVLHLAAAIDAILVLSDATEPAHSGVLINISDIARDLAQEDIPVEAPDEALVEGDERLLTLALRNLIENAERYAGGARGIRVSREGELVRLSVFDTGPGLDEEARTRVFRRYSRAAADAEGKGLGLAFVRAVAERHGGSAEARPGPNACGLEVSVLLGPVAGWHQ